MATNTVTIEQFVADNRINLTSEWADRNPNMSGSEREMDNYKCLLRMGRSRMTVYFSKSMGHHGAEPEATEVLSCLASDAAGVENAGNFVGWCSEFGYDEDSRTAERTWKACKHATARLKRFLGDELYDHLVWHTEDL